MHVSYNFFFPFMVIYFTIGDRFVYITSKPPEIIKVNRIDIMKQLVKKSQTNIISSSACNNLLHCKLLSNTEPRINECYVNVYNIGTTVKYSQFELQAFVGKSSRCRRIINYFAFCTVRCHIAGLFRLFLYKILIREYLQANSIEFYVYIFRL